MIDCSKCNHYEVCGNRVANDGCEGECGYFEDLRSMSEWKIELTGYIGKEISSIGYKCPLCNRRITWVPNGVYPTSESFLAKYPYCHCGAKMLNYGQVVENELLGAKLIGIKDGYEQGQEFYENGYTKGVSE